MSASEDVYAAAKKLAAAHKDADYLDAETAEVHSEAVMNLLNAILTPEDLVAAGFEPLIKE
jgi:hypothetical protein